MLPGFLHFDCPNSLRVELINGALYELALDKPCIVDALNSCGFSQVQIEVIKDKKGTRLRTQASLPEIGESLSEARAIFESKKVSPAISSLALAILDQLPFDNLGKDQLLELTILCAQVAKLDPKFISSSRIHISVDRSPCLNQVLLGLPVSEIAAEISADILSLAFLKALVGSWGPRGEHTLLKVGAGHGQDGTVLALWCEASLPESMNELGPSNNARLSSLYEICGLSPCTLDLPFLCTSLSAHGAKDFSWSLVHGEGHTSFYQVKFFCDAEDKRDVIEAFLIKGEANRVSVRLVEMHELNRRQVAIPLGTGNKTSSMRFWEYIYYDKIVRVEPVREDLDQYIIKTDYSADVARSDALLAWKKWRGRTAEDK